MLLKVLLKVQLVGYFNVNVVWRHVVTNLILHGGNACPALVAEVMCTKSGTVIGTTSCHIYSRFVNQSISMALPCTDRCQCCLAFGFLMGTELTVWSSTS